MLLRLIAFVRNVVGSAAQAAFHGHTAATATAAAAGVERAFEQAFDQRESLFDAIDAATSARVATIAAIHADLAAFDAIRRSL